MSFQTRKQSSVPQDQSKLSKNSAQAEFLCFCVFAGKNAVYLANQSCKDGESKALCHDLGAKPELCATTKALCHKTKANYPRIRHKTNNAKSAAFCGFCVFAGKNAVYLANQSCKDGKSKALCHNTSSVPQTQALCHNSKQTIQEFGTSRITQKAQLFAAFVSLQGKTLFIWQIKVAKTAKSKLCATKQSSVPCIIDIFFLFCRLIMFFH